MPGAWVPPGARQRPALDLDQVKSSTRCQTPQGGQAPPSFRPQPRCLCLRPGTDPACGSHLTLGGEDCGELSVRTGSFVRRTQLWELPQSLRVCLQT